MVDIACCFRIRIHEFAGLFIDQKQESIHLDCHLIVYRVKFIMVCMCIISKWFLSVQSPEFSKCFLSVPSPGFSNWLLSAIIWIFQVISFRATFWISKWLPSVPSFDFLLCQHLDFPSDFLLAINTEWILLRRKNEASCPVWNKGERPIEVLDFKFDRQYMTRYRSTWLWYPNMVFNFNIEVILDIEALQYRSKNFDFEKKIDIEALQYRNKNFDVEESISKRLHYRLRSQRISILRSCEIRYYKYYIEVIKLRYRTEYNISDIEVKILVQNFDIKVL